MSNTIFYFDLESVANRYTEQLSNHWMPYSFNKNKPEGWDIVHIKGKAPLESMQIEVGQVLDASGRSVYSLEQIIEFINLIRKGKVKNGDVLHFQDFWTPGIEAIYYTLDMYNIKVRSYCMLHAQTVDEYDFTHSMNPWMRFFELGIDSRMNGIFVGSQIHKDQLRAAGFKAPIYIVSLPFGKTIEVNKKDRNHLMQNKKNQVLYTSRFDFEKNIMFMLTVAERFLERHTDWEWIITTGATDIRSNDQFIIDKIKELESTNPRFKVIRNISKEGYYDTLAESKLQFNSSLQDYVSWTAIESTTFGCDLIYPNFRSFPEMLPENRMYKAFEVDSALNLMDLRIKEGNDKGELNYISEISELGLLIESYIMYNDWKEREFNVWLQREYVQSKFGFLKN